MIYLSRLLLDPTSRRVQADLRDPYQMHRTLCRGFGDRPGELSAARCLFRVEHGNGHLRVLVQSLLPPQWDGLLALPAYLIAPPAMKAFAPAFAAGERFAFRLHANPTVKRRGRRLGLSHQEAQYDWLQRKAEQSGFAVCSAAAGPPRPIDCLAGEGRLAHFLSVTFEGLLEVTDPPRLARGLARGIGSGKAFGFGLLSLAKV
jgi:CRISPR system Cascade subunit CasE